MFNTARFATADDAGLLLKLIRELAAYERAPNAVVATEEDLRRYGFGPERQFEALLAFLDGEPAGLALFHPRFSTWLGRPGVYLEDLFVTQAVRGKGVGPRLMTRLATIAVERGWERILFLHLRSLQPDLSRIISRYGWPAPPPADGRLPREPPASERRSVR